MTPEFPSYDYQDFVGKTVQKVEQADADEGLRLTFTDGTWIEIGFSGCEGFIETGLNEHV